MGLREIHLCEYRLVAVANRRQPLAELSRYLAAGATAVNVLVATPLGCSCFVLTAEQMTTTMFSEAFIQFLWANVGAQRRGLSASAGAFGWP